MSELEKKKQSLAEIRNLHVPVRLKDLEEFNKTREELLRSLSATKTRAMQPT